jgi:glycosyltransferase involved in cell wall biosynthesis
MTRRVLLIDSGREWRGGQRQVLVLARGLRTAGVEPLVVAIPDSPLIRRLRAHGVAAAAVQMRTEWDLAAVRRVRRLMRTWRADVVHAHDARAHSIALAALVGSETPLVVTRRAALAPRGRVKYGQRVARFIAISRAVRDALVRGGVERDRIDVVYSGVPRPDVKRARDWRTECAWPTSSVLCGIVGTTTSDRTSTKLASIITRLRPPARDRARLLLLGGPVGGRHRIAGVEAFRAGFVDAIHDAMAGLDLLLHPSQAEGLGTAVIDAMALGVPPIAFAVGALPELIEHERSGILVPAGDLGGFATAIARLVGDAELRGRLAAAGPARAALFSEERMIDATLAVYESVVQAERIRSLGDGER